MSRFVPRAGQPNRPTTVKVHATQTDAQQTSCDGRCKYMKPRWTGSVYERQRDMRGTASG